MRLHSTSLFLALLLSGPVAHPSPAAEYDVTRFGAVGDNLTLNTRAIQRAIDACATGGGGIVRIPAGTFRTGTIVLRSQVTLYLEPGAVLVGSTQLQDYPSHIPGYRSYADNYTERSLIYAEKAEGIAIRGSGVIDGQGKAFAGPYKARPYLVRFIECRHVTVEGVTFRDSPMWIQHYLACEDVVIHAIRVHSKANRNNDGIDIDSCCRVRISDCEISSGDDAIVLKATSGRPCRDVTITNCVLSSDCNAIKLGTESNGGFQNIVISNCAISDTRLSGLALEEVDGGTLERLIATNLVMDGVGCPIFVRLGNRARPYKPDEPKPKVGALRDVLISKVVAVARDYTGCSITGIPGHRVENVILRDIRVHFPGGGGPAHVTRSIPENEAKYPEHTMFGVLPAYGLFLRHVRNLTLENVQLELDGADARPALVAWDAEGLVMDGVSAAAPTGNSPLLWFSSLSAARIRDCLAPEGVGVFLKLDGSRCADIVLTENDLRRAAKPLLAGPDVPKDAVLLMDNLLPPENR